MAFSIGFDSGGGNDDGLFGSLGRSVAAATSPNAEGFTGRARAFLNPGPTLGVEAREQQLASMRPAYQQIADIGQKALRQLMADDEEGATLTMQSALALGEQNGIKPDDSIFKIFDTMRGAVTKRKLGEVNWEDPLAATKTVAGLASTVGEGLEGGRSIASITGEQARTALTKQQTEQGAGKYPYEVQALEKGNLLTDEQIKTAQANQENIAAHTGMYGVQTAGERVKNDIERERLKSVRDKGYFPSTGPGAAGGAGFVDDVAALYKEGQDIMDASTKGTTGTLGRDPLPLEDTRGRVELFNARARQLRAIYPGRDVPLLAVDEIPAQSYTDPNTKQTITTPAGARVRPMRPGEETQGAQQGQEPEPARRVQIPGHGQAPSMKDLTELTPQQVKALPQTITEADVQTGQFDESSFTGPQRQLYHKLREESLAGEAALKRRGASAQEIAAYRAAQSKKFYSQLLGGQ